MFKKAECELIQSAEVAEFEQLAKNESSVTSNHESDAAKKRQKCSEHGGCVRQKQK